jgi:hypothetical protein
MRTRESLEIVVARFHDAGLRRTYWASVAGLRRWARLLRPGSSELRGVAVRDVVRFLTGRIRPVAGETEERVRLAAHWLIRAHDGTDDDGVSFGYFPCEDAHGAGWRPSYPETTGYIIPTFLRLADLFDAPDMRERALRMAHWETTVQLSSGAVRAGTVEPGGEPRPAVFNTGMVLHGYAAVLERGDDPVIRRAAERAAEFLVGDVRPDGHFSTHGPHVHPEEIKTYNCLCAWPLLVFGDLSGEERYRTTAVRVVEAACRQQETNGWFANNCLERSTTALAHTIGYTLQGVLEVGILAKRGDFIETVQRGMDPLVGRITPAGFLHGRFDRKWRPTLFSSCLTGQAQLAVVGYRLAAVTGDDRYAEAADRMLDFLKGIQITGSSCADLNGGIAGSFPITGSYMPCGLPNWAAKYFVDGLLLQMERQGKQHSAGSVTVTASRGTEERGGVADPPVSGRDGPE